MKRMIKWFRNLRLQKKIVWTYMLVCIIPIMIVGEFAYMQSNEMVKQTETGKMRDYLLQLTFSMSNQINIYENLADYIAYNESIYQVINYPYEEYYQIYERYTALLDPFMTSMRYFNTDVSQIIIYSDNIKDEYGTVLAPLSHIENESWLHNLNEQRNLQWFVKNEKAFFVRQMLSKNQNDANSYLYVEVLYDKLFQGLQVLMEENIGIIVADESNKTIFEHNNFLEEYEHMALSNIDINKNLGEVNLLLGKYMVSMQTIESCNWTLCLYKPVIAYPNTVQQIIFTIFIIIIVSMLIMYGVSYAASALIVHPIKHLTENMKEYANDGKLEVTITSDTKDEVGIMIRSFEKMANRINVLINENYKNQINLKEFELRALQAQINPHFLYNTLSMINWKALQAGEEDISQIALRLSSFYRTTLNKGNSMTMLKNELQNIHDYLEIQLFMHDWNFDVVTEVSEDILNYQIPNLILQPIVENSIEHGLDLKEDGKGKLTIRGMEKGNNIILEIEDNGVGIKEEVCKKLLGYHSKGYGVKNVNDRIRLVYGEPYCLTISSEQCKGTIVSIQIPKKTTYFKES